MSSPDSNLLPSYTLQQIIKSKIVQYFNMIAKNNVVKNLKPILAGLILILSVTYCVHSQTQAEITVNNFILKQAKEYNVKEYKGNREVFLGDINGDGIEDLTVLYTLDGFKTGISNIGYLAVFLNNGGKFQYADYRSVSGVIERLIKLESIDYGTIRLKTLEYLESGKNHYRINGKIRFILSNGKLKEI